MTPTYIESMRQHTQEQLDTLAELAELATQAPLRKIERLAVERSLQILVEAAIGVAKHCCKQANIPASGDGYGTALKAHDMLQSQIPHAVLKGAIGMRNAIVHDYLNLDWTRIEAVLVSHGYRKIGTFIDEGLGYLSSQP
ncbi:MULTISPECIES: type VII toxin-antitoxin system HepT family RNase toxin [Oceanospirillaceae]|jgi:uncharacterized protein YutE (UPF0331/DUF86 family)|uniref:DUF86 domain-containing protein n=1 Tax=Oceanobacter antarcticus TaxID=3133425 RepID=A0ABW8NGE0_9GAMM|tara:strand:- start:172 stop:591 length:420 start_codon:yes stop_codon:yes gene_type:complete